MNLYSGFRETPKGNTKENFVKQEKEEGEFKLKIKHFETYFF